jgi:pimeloyl-ACP methyl ester carboxylesterase
MPEISIQGYKLAFEAKPAVFDASALAVVFIHGTGGDQNDWRYQLDGLSDRFTVISLSLPGHGDSEGPAQSSVATFSQRVSDFVETLGLQKVVMVGCSLGSAITLWLAIAQKPWLAGIGLVGSGGRLRVHPALLDGVLQDKDKALEMLGAYALGQDPDTNLRNTVLEQLRRNPAEVIHADLAACNAFDVMDRLREISVPVVIIVGEEDKLTPVKYSRFLQEGISGSDLRLISGAGHLVMLEKPAEFNTALADFVSGVMS